MNKCILSFIIILFSLAPFQNVNASHAVAADLTYVWLGGNNYQARLYFYRDCSGINVPNSITLNASSTSCGLNQNFTMTLSSSAGVEIPPICIIGLSTCNGGSVFGIREYIYLVSFTLTGNCTDWRLSYSVCCRNAAITNISAPGSAGQYFYAYLNNLNFSGNTSPKFLNKPAPYQCINNPYCFDMSATDADGDSLVYRLVTPMRTATNPVTFLAGYTPVQPINSSPLMTMNSTTGLSCVWPLTQGVYCMAVRVYEYRNGQLIGSIIRDLQQNLTLCPCVVLPVELLEFKATPINNKSIQLDWSTASEENADYYILERSFDADNFEEFGRVNAAGNSNKFKEYDFIDHNPGFNSIIYYRLKEVDKDGHVHTLKTIAQKVDRHISFVELVNNPVKNEMNLLFSNLAAAGEYDIHIIDQSGRIVKHSEYKKQEGMALYTLYVNELPPSIYFVRIKGIVSERLIKVVVLM